MVNKGNDSVKEELSVYEPDKKKLVFQDKGVSTRAKRVQANDESFDFEEPKVVGRRVKLEKGTGNGNKRNSKEKEIKESGNNANVAGSKNGKNSKKKNMKSLTKEQDEEDIVMEGDESINNIKESGNKINNNKNKITKASKTNNSLTEIKPNASKSTTYSDTSDKNSLSPELSSFTKGIIQQMLKKKQEKEESNKNQTQNSNFNYLTFNQVSHVDTYAKQASNIVNINSVLSTAKKNQLKVEANLDDDLLVTPIKTPGFSGVNSNFSLTPNTNTNINTTPVKQEMKLSLKTIEEINKLKTERQNRFKRETSTKERTRSESSFSLKFKYEELLREERELILPPHYKSLYNSFIHLDNTLSYFKMSSKKQRVPLLEEVINSIESTYKHKFDFKTFAQILYVAPHFFIYKWEKTGASADDFSLIIDIPKDHKARISAKYDSDFNFVNLQTDKFDPIIDSVLKADLEERQRVFKNLLYEIVNEHHKAFLEAIHFPKEFDPFKFRTWHHDFNLDNIPSIPIFEILEKPTIKITSIKDFLRDSDITNSLVKRAVKEYSGVKAGKHSDNSSNTINTITTNPLNLKIQIDSKDDDETSSRTTNTSTLSKFLSSSFLNKMKAKEEAVSISKNIIEYSNQKHRNISKVKDYQNIADKLKTIFMMQKSTTVPLIELSSKIYNSAENMKISYSIESIRSIIIKFKEIFPGWITILEHTSLGTLVKMDNNYPVKDVIERLGDLTLVDQIHLSIGGKK